MITRPMLAGKCTDYTRLDLYPVLASPKLDGIRCLRLHDGRIVTRTFKPLPNDFTRLWCEKHLPKGIDGELLVHDLRGQPLSFNECQSQLMRKDGEPNFIFHAFDLVSKRLDLGFEDRLGELEDWVEAHPLDRLEVVRHVIYPAHTLLLEFEAECLQEGYEGVMLRKRDGPYKCGRSTEKEGWLLKLKRFEDAEAEVVGFEERMHNANTAETNAFGLTKRSSHKANQVPTGALGALVVKDLKTGIQFGIGSGFTESQRKEFWTSRKSLIGKLVTYKFQPTGLKEAPRFPVFKGFRSVLDIGG